jgi:hypothetical protein
MNQNISPNKLPKTLDNPIDNWILEICDKMDPLFVQCDMTPNKLTTISAYFGLLSVYCLYNRIKYLPGIFYFISYMFDGADGQYARRHNMVSKFGDYYDHFKDWTIMFMIFYILYKRGKMYLGIFIFSLSLSGSHIGCQEHYYRQNNPDKEHSDTIGWCRYLCPFENTEIDDKRLERAMEYTRYFGLGTSNLLVSIILFFV